MLILRHKWNGEIIGRCCREKTNPPALKTVSYHDANFVVTGAADAVVMTAYSATNDDNHTYRCDFYDNGFIPDTKYGVYGPLTRYAKLRVVHAPGMPGTFSPPSRVSDPDMHYDTCVADVPWYLLGSLTSGFLWSRWRGKRSRHSRRMCNPQFSIW